MYRQLSNMGLEVSNDEERDIYTLQENELHKILQNDNESEEYEDLNTGSNVDVFRLEASSNKFAKDGATNKL